MDNKMDSSSSNDDDEPKICTVFSSSLDQSGSKSVFDTIAFSVPKKDTLSPIKSQLSVEDIPCSTASLFSSSLIPSNQQIDPLMMFASGVPTFQPEQISQSQQVPTDFSSLPPPVDIFAELSSDYVALSDAERSVRNVSEDSLIQEEVGLEVTASFSAVEDVPNQLAQAMEGLNIEFEGDRSVQRLDQSQQQLHLGQQGQGEGGGGSGNEFTRKEEEDEEEPSIIPTANSLFANAPDVPFPVGVGEFLPPNQTLAFQQTHNVPPSGASAIFSPDSQTQQTSKELFQQQQQRQQQQQQQTAFSAFTNTAAAAYSPITDGAYDAWIPKEETRVVLQSIAIAIQSGTYFPDKNHMTTPGIIYEDDLIDKVGVNMGRIFGEAEASKRRILTADNVTQDDNGLRELVKLGCYRSAINLTKRLLTLYGQGPGKVGHFSKNNPHTLQLWFTRIALLVRIREFAIAESEIDAFKDFDNPDMYYEYYPDAYGQGRKGSMVPFNFRLLAAEIVQYSRKHNETLLKLIKILKVIEQILGNIRDKVEEDGTKLTIIDNERQTISLKIWQKREIRVYYSLANASLFAKDYHNTFKYLSLLCEKDKEKEPQLKSAIGRLFLQLGDLQTANKYFTTASDLRPGDAESEQTENLVDSAIMSIAQGAYSEAFALFQQALVVQPDNFMITNNMAVCLLYMGKVKDSLNLMETTVKNNIPQLLQENVLLNLSTIYELENTDGQKKNGLLKLISEYKGDGINLASLKMPNLI